MNSVAKNKQQEALPERNSSIGAAMETVAEIWVKRTKRAGRRL